MLRDFQSFWPIQPPGLYLVLVSFVFYLIGLVLGRWLKRRVNVELGWTSHLFIASASIVIASRLLKIQFPGSAEIGLLAAITAAFPINALLHRFVWPLCGFPGEEARIPSFLPQVVAILVFVVSTFFGLAAWYHVTIPGLLTGSGVIAIIIGLALQETLGNIFAGFGLQAGKAYRVGDWLIIDGKHVEVVELNWRSTRFRNNDDVSFDIPNSQLAKATIVNLYYPSPKHAARVRLSVDHRVPPNEVKDAMRRAASAAPGVLRDPPVKVFLIDFAESAVQYEVKFWLMDGRIFPDIIDGVRTNVWYELNRRGIRLAFSTQQIELVRSVRLTPTREMDLKLLASQALFSSLDQIQLEHLALGSKRSRFGKGERIISQGEAGNSMFILASGKAEVHVEREGRSQAVGMLAAGDCFGEISLLTGEPRSATVLAALDCEVIEIEQETIGILLREHPELAESLSDTVVARRSATETQLASAPANGHGPERDATKEGFLRRLRKFFQL
ncbi:MAG: mechanosensitive ion channel [Verrucomicrobia bacterium]|nr:mechanosensitive ion channel [Verrucomicrobiota bacterium]